jgi:hypothetical protein
MRIFPSGNRVYTRAYAQLYPWVCAFMPGGMCVFPSGNRVYTRA